MSYNQYNQNPYQQDSTQDSSYGYGQANPYAQDAPAPGNNQYEMQDYSQQAPAATSSLSQQEFLNRVQKLRDEIKGLTDDVDYIGQLHQRTLSSTDGSANHDLEQYVTQTQIRNTAIKDGIKGLERDLAKTNDSTRTTKTTQLQSLNTFFKSELNKYQSIESDYRQRYRDQIARQYRIVNPDASEQEVQEAASADWGNEGVFQTALRTNRTGHASSVLGNVRARHSELQRIEQTLNELSILFQELATVVEQQEPVINAAEQNAINANDHMIKGNEQVEVAKKHALNRRKLKWWCALVVLLIIIAIAVGVGVGVTVANNNKK